LVNGFLPKIIDYLCGTVVAFDWRSRLQRAAAVAAEPNDGGAGRRELRLEEGDRAGRRPDADQGVPTGAGSALWTQLLRCCWRTTAWGMWTCVGCRMSADRSLLCGSTGPSSISSL